MTILRTFAPLLFPINWNSEHVANSIERVATLKELCQDVLPHLHFKPLEWRFGYGSLNHDANEYKSQYLPGSTEAGLMISVSVLPQDLEAALQWLQHELGRLNDRHNWGLCWIHTEVQAVTARHFSLN